MKLTKEAVLQGTKRRVTVDVPEIEEGGTLTVRPLTEVEAAEYQSTCIEGLRESVINKGRKLASVESEDDIQALGLEWADLKQMQRNQAKATAYAAACGLSCDGEKWTPDEVGTLPQGVPARIASKALDISGMKQEGAAMARQFRADAGSGKPDSDAPTGIPHGPDDGGVDADAVDGTAND